MDCKIKIDTNKIARRLTTVIGANVNLHQKIYNNAIVNEEFDSKFIDWYNKNHKEDFSNIELDTKKVVYAMKQYWFHTHPSVNETSRLDIGDNYTKKYGYVSIFDRDFGKTHIGTYLLDVFNKVQANSVVLPKNKFEFYKNAVKNQWLNLIFNKAANNSRKSVETLRSEYNDATDKTAYINKILGGNKKDSTSQNYYAVYQELFGSEEHTNNYIKEVLTDTRLGDVLHQVDKNIQEDETKKEVEESKDEQTNNDNVVNQDSDDFDVTISMYNSHAGAYSNVMMHVGGRIKNYFNTLRKLSAPTIGAYDTNNSFGIPETMDANACSTMLFNSNSFNNVEQMIAEIERIANTVRGFEAFIQLAKDLRENKDFAIEMFTVFAKFKISNIEVVEENGKTITRIANQRSNPKTVAIIDAYNDIKTTAINNDSSVSEIQLRKLERSAEDIDKLCVFYYNNKYTSKEQKADEERKIKNKTAILTEQVVNIVRSYFPSVQAEAIKAFIDINRFINSDKPLYRQRVDNIFNILNDIKNTIEKSDITKQLYSEQQRKLQEIREHNRNVQSNYVNKRSWTSVDDYKSYRDAFGDDYIKHQQASALSLIEKVLPYSVIQTDLNARNIHGNNTSSILNTSHITKLEKMFENTYIDENGRTRYPGLEAWGAKKLRSNQYKYSNILLEQKDEKGNVINKGLFRYVNGGLVVTEYANKMFAIQKLNGSSNIDAGNNLSYSDMTMGDFLPTSIQMFFKSIDSNNKDFPLASYFLRTPSDAPQAFLLRTNRYNTDGLFKIKDIESFNKDVKQASNEYLRFINKEEFETLYRSSAKGADRFQVVEDGNSFYRWLFPPKSVLIQNFNAVKKIKGTENEETGDFDGYLTVYNKDTNDVIIVRGIIQKAGKGHKITNSELVGAFKIEESEVTDNINVLREIVYDKIKDKLKVQNIVIGDVIYNKPEEIIDIEHPVFKMFSNAFKQEMLDAATALKQYFKLRQIKSGNYIVDTIKDENGEEIPYFIGNNTKGYKFYHLDKNGKVYTKSKNDYTLDGNVFHSNKFTLITTDENGDIIQKNYLDELISNDVLGNNPEQINFLYGRSMEIVMNEEGNVTDVIFTTELQNAINNKINEYIIALKEQAINEVLNKKDFINDITLNNDNITNYIVNQVLTHYVFDELFEGNSKFYKDTQTILKRAKEYQAAGIPYGIVNYSQIDEYSLEEIEDSFLNSGEIQEPEYEDNIDDNGKLIRTELRNDDGTIKTRSVKVTNIIDNIPELKGTRQRNAFKAVTVKNSVATSYEALNELVGQLHKLGMDEERAKTLLFGEIQYDNNDNPKTKDGQIVRRGGFSDTKVNDAQSYITYKEWVRRVAARGQLQKYLPLIKKISDPNSILTANDIDEFIQVQKNIYYDLYYDSRYGIEVPRLIKNAEFVLIPRFIQGTQLEKVHDMMIEAGIDQLNTIETSKAANEEILTLWDDNGDISDDKYSSFVSEAKSAYQIYSYNSLYTQQETPQHMNTTNKAGIQWMKKIIDNIPANSELYKLKEEFFNIYSANIEESFNVLLKQFNIPVDKNGNIKLDEDGNIESIDLSVFLSKLKEQLLRTGCDNNMSDYVTINPDTGLAVMPAEMNNILSKFESVVQSVFNNNITRQKLPGFHAAQITNIGWKSHNSNPTPFINKKDSSIKISKEEYNKLDDTEKKLYKDIRVSYDKKLKYHPDGKPYIEVILPYSYLGIDRNSRYYKNKSDNDILVELAKDNLDMIIGYRIPTEGKQSACNMKVVGFIDDSLGSTIVVPDEWVAQTGSDFDIDSVYGIQPYTYISPFGKVNKYQYKENLNETDYIKYVRQLENQYQNEEIGEKLQEVITKLQNLNDKTFNELNNKLGETYNKLGEANQTFVKKINKQIDKKLSNSPYTNIEKYETRIIILYAELNAKAKQLSVKFKNTNSYKALVDYLKVLKEVKQNLNTINSQVSDYEEIAIKAGLLSFSDFIKPENVIKANGLKARTNRLIEDCQKILADDLSLEENLSRSNFDEFIAARNRNMSKNQIRARELRSSYNPFDQMRYQEEAMSGAKLKARSVVLDNMCSICNTVQPTLTRPITIVYNENSIKSDNAKKGFNVTSINDKEFSISHDTYGWSKNNRNVSGFILTAYSSQTTAYILDAIKEGSVPNVNDYTFGVLKTLANIGTNYDAALSFIMQPAIAKIVQHYNSSNSVFSTNKINPIHETIRDLAKELEITVADNAPIVAVVNSINSVYNKEFNDIFNKVSDEDLTISLNIDDNSKIPLIVSKLSNRISEEDNFQPNNFSSPVERILFDLGVVLSFNSLLSTSKEIDKIATCCNPDNFGAKQTVYATRKVFDTMDECVFKVENNNGLLVKERKQPILSVKNKHILESIYPDIFDETFNSDDMINKLASSSNIVSSYPPLYSFLKYASATSVIVARQVFSTQNFEFVNLINGIRDYFSDGANLDEDIYNDFQKYVLGTIYNECPSIKYPITVSKGKKGIEVSISPSINTKFSNLDIASKETARIYGYSQPNSFAIVEDYKGKTGRIQQRIKEIVINDVNNPSEDELRLFEQMSPAQKVAFIQKYFDDAGVFGLLKVQLFNSNARGRWQGMQTIEFNEQNINSNVVYAMFKRAFNNNNPLIVSTAIDIIKYAVQVEGLRMSKTAVNKIIDNSVYYNDFSNTGLGFADYFRQTIANLTTSKGLFAGQEAKDSFYENYLRSHSNTKNIRKIYLSEKNKAKYGLNNPIRGMYYLSKNNTTEDDDKDIKEFNKLLTSIGIKYQLPISEIYITNKYIKLQKGKEVTLYKIQPIGEDILLYPLSKLEPNENSQWSANELNNEIALSKPIYETLSRIFIEEYNSSVFERKYVESQINKLKKTNPELELRYKNRKQFVINTVAEDFKLQDLAKEEGGVASNLLTKLQEFYKQSENRHKTMFVFAPFLNDYITSTGAVNGHTEAISVGNNKRLALNIYKPTGLDKLAKDYLRNKETDIDDTLDIEDDSLIDIMKFHKTSGLKSFNSVFVIKPTIETNILASSNENQTAFTASYEESSQDLINFSISTGELLGSSSQLNSKLNQKGIGNSISSIRENKDTVLRELSRFTYETSMYIKDKLFDQFVKDPENPDSYIPITDDRVQQMIKKDNILLNKYITACNIAKGFVDKGNNYKDYNVESEEDTSRLYIENIKRNIDSIAKLPISQLMEKGVRSMVESKSANPLVREGLIDAMDAYWKSYGSMWGLNDICENGTIPLQVILNDVLTNIDAQNKQAKQRIKDYWDEVNNIIAEAKANGKSVDINKIIDADGRFIRDYDNSIVDEYMELSKTLTTTIKVNGLGSIEHLKAKLEYDKFKTAYFNQEASPEYYHTRNQLVETALREYPEYYSKFKKLNYEFYNIYNSLRNEELTDDDRQKLDEIGKEQAALFNPEFHLKEDGTLEFVGSNATQEDINAKYGLSEINKKIRELEDEYFENKAVPDFKNQVKTKLAIIREFEQPDENGIPTVSRTILNSNPRYVAAKDWIRKNAMFRMQVIKDGSDNPLSLGARLQKAFKRIGLNSKGKSSKIYDIFKNSNNQNSIFDAQRIPDGRLLTEQEVEQIREEQRKIWNINNAPVYTDKILISNASPNNEDYNSLFWDMLRVNKNKDNNREYLETVTKINKILEKYYSSTDNKIHLENIKDDASGIAELKELADLYQKLRAIRASNETTSNARAAKFMQENVEFIINKDLFNYQNAEVQGRSEEFMNAWIDVIYERKANGDFVTKDNKFVANRFLYSYIHLKDNVQHREHYIDKEGKQARELIDSVYIKVPTKYFNAAKQEAISRQEKDPNFSYKDWYLAQHIYNPFTRKMELLPQWVTSEIKLEHLTNELFDGDWYPIGRQAERKVKNGHVTININGSKQDAYFPERDKTNHNYDGSKSTFENYNKGSNNGKYDSTIELNDYEKRLREHLYNTLIATAKVSTAKNYFEKGYLPKQYKAKSADAKMIAKELGKIVGIGVSSSTGDDYWKREIGFDTDYVSPMPMTQLLNSKNTVDIKKKIAQIEEEIDNLKEEDFDSKSDFENKVKELQNTKDEFRNQLREERRSLLDKDWLNVISNYLTHAANYNAIQDNKQKLYYLHSILKNIKMYSRKHGIYGDLEVSDTSTKENVVYEKSTDDDVLKQYETFIRRLLFNQYKENDGILTRLANNLQNYTSANYMMFNVRGGIANVTLGETSIFAEAAAKEYFTPSEWAFGTNEWMKGSISFARAGYEAMFNNDQRSFSKQDAIIKYMNVVDYDEVTGVSRELSLEEYSKRIRDIMFSPQTMSEHFMQNSVLFAMLKSHKLVTLENGDVIPMTKRQYVDYRQSILLNDILDDEQRIEYKKFKDNIKKDKNILKDYAWFRRNSIVDFIYLHCNKEQNEEFVAKRKKQQENIEKEFDDKADLYSQLKLGEDGTLAFEEGSKLAELNNIISDNFGDITKATEILAKFAEKTRKVNNKIHGVYNRLGAAHLEKTWYGSLIMQYHKHLPMGLLKRYRNRGYFNEFRGTVEKGLVQTMKDVASLNLEKVRIENGLNTKEEDALKGFIFMITHLHEYVSQLSDTLAIIPNYEKANLMRNAGDAIGVLAAMATVAALWYMTVDNPELEDSMMFNLTLYEADRLCSEAFMYNPYGLINEGKKLMSQPIAANSIINDASNTLQLIGDWMLNDEYDPYYHQGRFAGESKFSVYLQRRTPIWNGIRNILDVNENNHYYKLGESPITGLNIKETVTK